MTWRRLDLLIDQVSLAPGTNLNRQLLQHPDWTVDRLLLTRILYAVDTANVQRHNMNIDPKKTRAMPPPEQVLPPWVTPPPKPNEKRFGRARMTFAEAKRWLGW